MYRYDPNGRVNRPLPPPPPATVYSEGGGNWDGPVPTPSGPSNNQDVEGPGQGGPGVSPEGPGSIGPIDGSLPGGGPGDSGGAIVQA